MTRNDVQRWLDRYVEAWQSYDPARIGDLFSEAAVYRGQPWESDGDSRGRDAIVEAWLKPGGDESKRDAPGTFEAHYEPYAVDGDRAVATGTSRYWSDASRTAGERTFDNVFLLEFDADGRCSSYTELYMERPKDLG